MRKSIAIPSGLPCGKLFFQPIAEYLCADFIVYPPVVLAEWKSKNIGMMEEIFQSSPSILVLPSEIKIDSFFVECANRRVKSIGSVATGTDNVDIKILNDNGIDYFNAPGENSLSVVEYVLSAMPLFFDENRLLSSHIKVGIIGFGRIGRILAEKFEKLNISYSYFDPYVDGFKNRETLENVLSSDYITFHTSLTVDGKFPSFEMIDMDSLSNIQDDAVIVNSARGKIFTTEAYAAVCKKHRNLMDVFYKEPPPNELLEAAQYATPHIAGYDYLARAKGTRRVAVDFAEHIGMDMSLIPEIPDAKFELNTIDFIPFESENIKKFPESFRERRMNYPNRANFASMKSEKSYSRLTTFQKRLVDIS